MVKLLARTELHAVACGPTIKLCLCPAAEAKQLGSELFHEVHQAGNAGFLCFIGTAERHAGDMNMQPTGACAVAAVTELLSLMQDILPRHII